MALTRKMLSAMGIEEAKIEQIIEAHTETVDGLKQQLSAYKDDAERLPGVQKELDDLKAKPDDGWKQKYEDEHSAYESFRADVTKKETRAAKENAFRALLREAGISEKRIDSVLRVSDVDGIKLDRDGNITGAAEMQEKIKTEWADFIPTTTVTGANPPSPPSNVGGKTFSSRAEIMAIKDATERQRAIAENLALFNH